MHPCKYRVARNTFFNQPLSQFPKDPALNIWFPIRNLQPSVQRSEIILCIKKLIARCESLPPEASRSYDGLSVVRLDSSPGSPTGYICSAGFKKYVSQQLSR